LRPVVLIIKDIPPVELLNKQESTFNNVKVIERNSLATFESASFSKHIYCLLSGNYADIKYDNKN
jgi:hypothetical protein